MCIFTGGERNAVGAGVWKRVRLKLEGRDDTLGRDTAPARDSSTAREPAGRDTAGPRRLALHEHVDAVIRDAVSWGNLCHMYEGWMAWV